MGSNKILVFFKNNFAKFSEASFSLRSRLLVSFMSLAFILIAAIFAMLVLTGTFNIASDRNKKLIESEINKISEDMYKAFGDISVQTVSLSETLSSNIEFYLSGKNISFYDLQNNPDILEDMINSMFDRILFALEKSKTSGVFVILNTTVNPTLKNSQFSKAGLYIQNAEPNVLNASASNILILRGFPSCGRLNSIPLHSQWDMEFDVSEADYYNIPVAEALKNNVGISKMYYWTPAMIFPNTSEEVMLCSIPVIDSDGNILGVCGFDVSSLLFKHAYLPENSIHNRIFSMLSPVSRNVIYPADSFFAGRYNVLNSGMTAEPMEISYGNNFNTYKQTNGIAFSGMSLPLKLYSDTSPFVHNRWAVSVMMPESDLSAIISRTNITLSILCAVLILLGVWLSFFLTRNYIKPIMDSFDIIKSEDLSSAPKTKILEIDDLLEFLSSQGKTEAEIPVSAPAESGESKSETLSIGMFDEFVENTKTLSPAERSVFNLYVEGYTAKEIASILCLSINTIKTHNRRIYTKLNIASRKELLLYVNMLKEAGKEL